MAADRRPMTTVEVEPGEEGDDYDDPRSSSAAQCIRFRILLEDQNPHELQERNKERPVDKESTEPPRADGKSPAPLLAFAPEFTHQVFPGEWIRGYQPFAIRRKLVKPHRTFVHHILATHEVDVEVGLAPDCATCRVAIRAAPLEGDGDGSRDGKPNDDRDARGATRQVGSVPSPLRAGKRPQRHASMIADKRMKKQRRDEADPVHSDESEDSLPAESTTRTRDANEQCDSESPRLNRKGSATARKNYDDGGDRSVPEGESHSYESSSEEFDCEDDFEDDLSDANENGETRSRRMTLKEIRDTLAKALPPIVTVEEEEDDDQGRPGARPKRRFPRRSAQSAASTRVPRCMTSFLSEPVGSVVGEPYTVKAKSGGGSLTFVLALAEGSDPRVADYHGRVQRLATWFIETADEVDVTRTKDGGYWRILYVFRRQDGDGRPNPSRHSLAGYMTLYHFRSPFRKPKPGVVVRICQALVLPPYQRIGLGHFMLKSVYDLADQPDLPPRRGKGSAEGIVEFNVEDPAPAFTALRNRVDYDRFRALPRFHEGDNAGAIPPVEDESFFAVLSDAQVSEASAQLRITPTQVHVVHELEKLRALNEHVSASSTQRQLAAESASPAEAAPVDELLQKRYRLMVKKRLNRLHREDLGGLSKPEAQRVLGELFDDCHRQYQRILQSGSREEGR